MKIHTPSASNKKACTRIRPRIPILGMARSLRYPPTPRAKRFMNPNIDAIAEAVETSSSKTVLKKDTAALFTVNSTPKQHA
mmetsp:Transcript_30265/g.34894  ORF Transcript_30265/g.34894 Transcript_30265/m.34894 type:complete len:81 (-) Transcript_30265:1255-1497(-)